MLLYLDLNCFNRPFDDQNQARIAEETEAVFLVLQRIEEGEDQMVWSAVLEFENSQHPLADRRDETARWGQIARCEIAISEAVAARAHELEAVGFHALDALHLASAEAANCDRFLTCDDRLLRRARRSDLAVLLENPIEYARGL